MTWDHESVSEYYIKCFELLYQPSRQGVGSHYYLSPESAVIKHFRLTPECTRGAPFSKVISTIKEKSNYWDPMNERVMDWFRSGDCINSHVSLAGDYRFVDLQDNHIAVFPTDPLRTPPIGVAGANNYTQALKRMIQLVSWSLWTTSVVSAVPGSDNITPPLLTRLHKPRNMPCQVTMM